MRVLHVGKLCPPSEGGIEVFTHDLLEFLNNRGIRADLLCFGKECGTYVYKNFTFYSCKMNLKFASAPLSLNYVKQFLKIAKTYDILHIHAPNPLGEIISFFTNKRVIIHWHSDIVKQRFLYKFYRPFQKRVLQKSSRIIATSPHYLYSSGQLKEFLSKAEVIPLGLNPQRLEEELNEQSDDETLARFDRRKIVLSIGRLVYYKGFEYLIEAGKYLDDDVVILIAGGGPLYGQLERMIKAYSLERRVFLLGRVERVAPIMRGCHLFCLPSITRTEAFGLVLLEALYFGKPLITTDVPGSGMSYVNIHGETGLIVPPRDPRALAEAIKQILNNPEIYEKFSENARRRFEEFAIQKIGERIVNLYRSLLT